MFSSLDKLGTVLNELFDLNTSKVKTHFSYFTVLRQFAHLKVHPELGGKLTAIKEEYGEVLGVLRRRRNTEIHYMNSEMKDDLWQRHQALTGRSNWRISTGICGIWSRVTAWFAKPFGPFSIIRTGGGKRSQQADFQ
ncbi:hypothetical protein HMSSN036_69620 [Paenibacillus macerans]|nr:hypothetical protein HMSSN036_69620 [Paenibacillus macerans]